MILTLMIVFGVIVGGVALFGAGGWLRRRQDQIDEDARQPRPQHMAVENETSTVLLPRQPSSEAQPPE